MRFFKQAWNTVRYKSEFIYAFLLGAPVKDKQGRTWKRPSFRRIVKKVLDRVLWGVDLSKWQGIIDWVKLKAGGVRFIILRASYGITTDERFTVNIAGAVAVFVGWLFGVYHYYDPRYSPEQQANKILATIRPFRKYIKRVWIDLEFTWGGNYEASSNWKRFAELILADGFEIGFYTRKTWWDSRVGSLAWWFAQFPLWAAQYSSNLTMIPAGWGKASIWQDGTPLTADYFEPGTMESKEFDHDISDDEFFATEFDGVVEPPPTGGQMYKCINNVAIRDAASYYNSNRIDVLYVGDEVDAVVIDTPSDPIPKWLKFSQVKRANGTVKNFPSPVYCSANSAYVEEIIVTPPPPTGGTITFTATLNDDGTLTGTWSEQ